MAETINAAQLAKLIRRRLFFPGRSTVNSAKENLPTAIDLKIKAGAQIMMLNNDIEGRWVNGSIGEIKGLIQNAKVKTLLCRTVTTAP